MDKIIKEETFGGDVVEKDETLSAMFNWRMPKKGDIRAIKQKTTFAGNFTFPYTYTVEELISPAVIDGKVDAEPCSKKFNIDIQFPFSDPYMKGTIALHVYLRPGEADLNDAIAKAIGENLLTLKTNPIRQIKD